MEKYKFMRSDVIV